MYTCIYNWICYPVVCNAMLVVFQNLHKLYTYLCIPFCKLRTASVTNTFCQLVMQVYEQNNSKANDYEQRLK